jgi:cytosine/adenosine deaminase-related metal-dependent hydrolase
LLVIDMMKPHLVPSGRILSAWIHNGQPSDIESVMVDGRFVIRDHELLTLNEAELMEEAWRIGERVWSRILENGELPLPRL